MQRVNPSFRRVTSCGLAIAFLVVFAALAQAQSAAKENREKATPAGVTDIISVAGGGEIRGAVVKRFPDGTLDVAVQRDWLDAHAPEAAGALLVEERLQTRAVMESLSQRLTDTIAGLPESRTRTLGLLRREADRIDAWLAAAEQARARDEAGQGDADADPNDRSVRPPAARRGETQFTLLRIGPKRVQKVRPSGQNAQRVARWAWSERLEDVEGRSAADLSKELKARGIDPLSPPPGLGDRLPPLPQDDREWATRMALVEDALGDPVAFQGFGDTVVKTGDTDGGLAGILPQLGQLLGGGNGGIGGLGLDDVLGGLKDAGLPGVPVIPPGAHGPNQRGRPADTWLASARAQAADAGRYRATRVKVDGANGRAEVESVFEVRMADGTWETIWREVQVADAAQADEAAVERITADERISGLLQAIRGVGIVSEANIMQAIRVGAATMAAQGAVDNAFNDFRSRHIQRLDGPPLRWDGR